MLGRIRDRIFFGRKLPAFYLGLAYPQITSTPISGSTFARLGGANSKNPSYGLGRTGILTWAYGPVDKIPRAFSISVGFKVDIGMAALRRTRLLSAFKPEPYRHCPAAPDQLDPRTSMAFLQKQGSLISGTRTAFANPRP